MRMKKSPWSPVHGFYVGICGLIIKVDDSLDYKNTLSVPDYPNLTLTDRGVANVVFFSIGEGTASESNPEP